MFVVSHVGSRLLLQLANLEAVKATACIRKKHGT